MHEYNHFILGNKTASLIQYNHHAALVHTLLFGKGRNAKNNENLIEKIQQAAANNIICSSTWYFLFKNQPTKKKQK